jgi:hypothetical protein
VGAADRNIEPRLFRPDSCTIRGVGRLLSVLAVVVLVLPACSEVGEQVDQATNDTVARALRPMFVTGSPKRASSSTAIPNAPQT